MNSQFFVPVTDDMIYNHPERIQGPLVPYEAGMECHEWLSVELNPEDDSAIEEIVKQRIAQKRAKNRSAKGTRGSNRTERSANLSLVYGAAFRS